MSSSNRNQMKGALATLRERQQTLRQQARNACETITLKINPALAEVEEMEIAAASAEMDQLVTLQAELLTIASKITRLERELFD